MSVTTQRHLTPTSVTEGRFDRLLQDALDDDLIWALRPKLSLDLLAASLSRPDGLSPVRPSGRAAAERAARRIALELRAIVNRPLARSAARQESSGGPWMEHTDGVLRLWSSENQRLAVGAAKDRSIRLPGDQGSWRARAGKYRRELRTYLGPVYDAFPSTRGLLHSLIDRTLAMQDRVVATLDEERPRVVVVSSTVHLYARLLVVEARRRGIASVYVPHAPAGLARNFVDLPTDLCLLGSEGERGHYLNLGGVANRMEIVGDPVASSVQLAPERQSAGARIIVFATSVDRSAGMLRDTLIAVAHWAAEADLPLIVAPHPRDRATAKLVAHEVGLPLHNGRTDELLAERNVALLITEGPSGVALTALRCGVPVLRWAGVPMYVFEEQLGIGSIADAGSDAPAALREGRHIVSARIAASKAQSWTGPVGDEAAANRDARLAAPVDPQGPTLDSWNHWT